MVELESDGELTRGEVAAFPRQFANDIDDGDLDRSRDGDGGEGVPSTETEAAASTESKRLTFIVGDSSATVTVPESVEFDVEVASHSPLLGSRVSQEIELELWWEVEDSHDRTDDDLTIE